jgi:hypothetical protein
MSETAIYQHLTSVPSFRFADDPRTSAIILSQVTSSMRDYKMLEGRIDEGASTEGLFPKRKITSVR